MLYPSSKFHDNRASSFPVTPAEVTNQQINWPQNNQTTATKHSNTDMDMLTLATVSPTVIGYLLFESLCFTGGRASPHEEEHRRDRWSKDNVVRSLPVPNRLGREQLANLKSVLFGLRYILASLYNFKLNSSFNHHIETYVLMLYCVFMVEMDKFIGHFKSGISVQGISNQRKKDRNLDPPI